jgi:hypothetical protein
MKEFTMPASGGDTEPAPQRPVWRRDRSEAAPSIVEADGQELRCGGPDFTDAERAELSAAAERRAEEAAEKAREEDDADKDQDEEDAAKDKRYAVTLLRQDTSAWGGSAAMPGVLG